ncbi:MAG: methylglyoxal synthase [Clostridia bacterium]|nr:methylglyoxal synthase [Clostridia bacterium]
MNIALLAHEKRKELMVQFCIAYAGILSKHNLSSGSALGNLITENTGLEVQKMLTGATNAEEQVASRISCDEIDILLFFRDPLATTGDETGILRLCDVHNVPLATNIATAEVIVMALDRGDLDWIEITKRK